MKLKQIYVLEDQGKYYYVRNNKILLLQCTYAQQNPDGLLKAISLLDWNNSLFKAVQSINSRARQLGKTKWEKKLQSIAVGLRDREKTVRKRSVQQKNVNANKSHLSFTVAMERCVNQANARTRHSKWRRWCNNASKNQHVRSLRKELEA